MIEELVKEINELIEQAEIDLAQARSEEDHTQETYKEGQIYAYEEIRTRINEKWGRVIG